MSKKMSKLSIGGATYDIDVSSAYKESIPISGSTNVVTSGGVKNALNKKLDLTGGTVKGTIRLSDSDLRLSQKSNVTLDSTPIVKFTELDSEYNRALHLGAKSGFPLQLKLEGAGDRPSYNDKSLALMSDIESTNIVVKDVWE